MTNPFAGGTPSPQPQQPPQGTPHPQSVPPQQVPQGGFSFNPEGNAPAPAQNQAQPTAAPAPFTTGGFGQPSPAPTQQQVPTTTSRPPMGGFSLNPESSGNVQPLVGTSVVTDHGVYQAEKSTWRLGDPVKRRSDLGQAPGPYIADRAPVTLASGRETKDIPGLPTYPMPGPIRAFEVTRNRYGHYCLPDPNTGRAGAFVRATTVAKAVADAGATGGLDDWKDRRLIYGLVQNPGLLEGLDVSLIGTDQEWTLNKTTAAIAEAARVSSGSADGREFGTALHAWTEAVDIGQATFDDVPDPMKRHVASYLYMLHESDIEVLPEYVERIVYCPISDSVGTVDRIFRLADGSLVIGDIKTSASIDNAWTSITAQLAQYATASHMLSADGSKWEPMPQVRGDIGVVASIPHTPKDRGIHCDIYPVNLQPGVALIQLAMAVRDATSSRARRAIALTPNVMDVVADQALAAVQAGLPAKQHQGQALHVSSEVMDASAAAVSITVPEGLDASDPRVIEALQAIESAPTVEDVVPLWQEWWPEELVIAAQRRMAHLKTQAEANAKRQETRAKNEGKKTNDG